MTRRFIISAKAKNRKYFKGLVYICIINKIIKFLMFLFPTFILI